MINYYNKMAQKYGWHNDVVYMKIANKFYKATAI